MIYSERKHRIFNLQIKLIAMKNKSIMLQILNQKILQAKIINLEKIKRGKRSKDLKK
jgi:hypothetical protein